MENNSINGLRWYFYEAYLDGKAMNVKEFANLVQVPDSTMGRYLNGRQPKHDEVFRNIEKSLGKPAYDLCKARRTLDWGTLKPMLYANKPTLRKYSYVADDEENRAWMVSEDTTVVDKTTIIEQQKYEIERLKDENQHLLNVLVHLRNVLKQLKHENELLQKLVNSFQYD